MLTRDILIISIFFGVLALLLFGTSALIGWLLRWCLKLSHNYGLHVGGVLALLCLFVAVYGSTIGFSQFRVRQVEIAFADLPKEFDGYRIAHLTDAHLGSFTYREGLLTEAIDSILAQDADMIAFTGDIQNHSPQEIEPFVPELSRLKARDGVYAVLGNHDYGYPPTAASPRDVRKAEERAGWRTLVNESVVIRRGDASIILGGMDNDGDGKHFPQRGDARKTLAATEALPDSDSLKPPFIVLLEHDPTSWRRNILKNSHAQLTLSGHTHAMQFGILGWSPSKWFYNEWRGLFTEGAQSLYVSSGIGGVIPFRFGMPREVVVITLRTKKSDS